MTDIKSCSEALFHPIIWNWCRSLWNLTIPEQRCYKHDFQTGKECSSRDSCGMDSSKCAQAIADYLHIPSLAILGETGNKGVMTGRRKIICIAVSMVLSVVSCQWHRPLQNPAIPREERERESERERVVWPLNSMGAQGCCFSSPIDRVEGGMDGWMDRFDR